MYDVLVFLCLVLDRVVRWFDLLLKLLSPTICSCLTCVASASRFCVLWIRNTMRNVTMVVAVLLTTSPASLKPHSRPVIAHAPITSTASMTVAGLPDASHVHLVKRVNQ